MLAFVRLSILSLLSFATFSVATPSKRQDSTPAQIESILNDLTNATNPIVAQLMFLEAGQNATNATVNPLMTGLLDAFNTTNAALANITNSSSTSTRSVHPRQSDDDIAVLGGNIIINVTQALDGVISQAAVQPNLKTQVPQLDSEMNTMVTSINSLMDGVTTAMGAFLQDVGGILNGLGFLTLAQTLGV